QDIENIDKQDDGAAHRLFHGHALGAVTVEFKGESIREGFKGLFVYLFVFGTLFDAWLNPRMTVTDRVQSALWVRFWLHYWRLHVEWMAKKFPDLCLTTRSFISLASFQIFNWLADTLVLLALTYSQYY
ncbi:hypothetical protein C8J56DRAFT_726124, partial [Mycena floridula]